MGTKKWPNFESKIFFRDFSRNFEIPKNFQMRFKKMNIPEFSRYIAQSKEETILFQMVKKNGGGGGGGSGSNFTLKILAIFPTLKIVAFHEYHELSRFFA